MRSTLKSWSTTLAASAMVFAASASTALAGASFDILEPNADPGNIGDFQLFAGNAFQSVINIILFVAGAVAIIYLIWAGFKYITAGGDPKKAEDARKGIINAIIGIIVIVAAFFIVRVAISAGDTATSINASSDVF